MGEACAEEKSWSYILGNKSIMRRIVVASMLQWLQQFSGINAVLGYGPSIFADAGVPLDPLFAQTVTNVVNFVFTIIMAYIIDILGRRILLLAGAVGMCISMLTAALMAQWVKQGQAEGTNTVTYGWCLFIAVNAFMASFAIGWGGVPWVYPSEIFPMDCKEKALSVSVFFQWFANFFIATIVPIQMNWVGAPGTFAFYGICLVF